MASDNFISTKIGSKQLINVNILEKFGITAKISTRDFQSSDEFLKTLDLPACNSAEAEQIHGNDLTIVTEKGLSGKKIAGVDGLITNIPNIPLIIRTADCLPLFILEPNKKVIALVHAGWEGTVSKIAENALKIMTDRFEISLSDCIIALGPSIKKDCYEVNIQVVEQLRKAFTDHKEYIKKTDKDHWLLDLAGLNIKLLTDQGVKKENIHIIDKCTHCSTDRFYSYRKEGKDTGRIYSVMMIKN